MKKQEAQGSFLPLCPPAMSPNLLVWGRYQIKSKVAASAWIACRGCFLGALEPLAAGVEQKLEVSSALNAARTDMKPRTLRAPPCGHITLLGSRSKSTK